jgi:hypothetical protein
MGSTENLRPNLGKVLLGYQHEVIAPRRAVPAQVDDPVFVYCVHLSDALGLAIIDKVAAGGFLAATSQG